MFNRKSIYALNKKDTGSIIYIDANGNIIRLTREDFDSEADFLKWKAWSDAEYHHSEKRDHVHANHTVSLDSISEESASTPAVDVCIELEHDRLEQIRHSTELVERIKVILTETQFRRLWMHYVDRMTMEAIALREEVSHQAISLSILTAIKKIKNLL
ncbi:MAG: sigma-70 family RNA polymerase sigma factor [Eubacteriaceae bacterium]|nr:sigma-70 family RNA polymerase sigma factor [Clostridium sp.]MDD7718048.1 sigma-70 family RNA polymerase sigma factor [Eubacteriaceae bacterium]